MSANKFIVRVTKLPALLDKGAKCRCLARSADGKIAEYIEAPPVVQKAVAIKDAVEFYACWENGKLKFLEQKL